MSNRRKRSTMNEQNEQCRKDFLERFGGYTVQHECTLGGWHRGTCVCRCGARELEHDTKPDEGPEDAPAEELGFVKASDMHMDMLGGWIAWIQWEGTATYGGFNVTRAGRLEEYAIPEYDTGNGITFRVNGVEYRVSREQRISWRNA